jgi:magnesium transporter
MIHRHVHDSFRWIDVESPTEEEILSLIEEFSLSPLYEMDLVAPTIRPRVEVYNKTAFLVFHFPDKAKGHLREYEIDFVIGTDYLITVRYSPSKIMNEVRDMFEENSILGTHNPELHPGLFFSHILKTFYKSSGKYLEEIHGRIDDIEQKIFDGHETAMVRTLSVERRLLLDMKRALRFHETLLRSLEECKDGICTNMIFESVIHGAQAEYYRIMTTIDAYRDILTELQETNDSLLTKKTNHTMKTLTMMSFVVFPLTLIAAIFSMDTLHTPIVNHPYGFWIILGIMVCAAGIMFAYFKYRKWI